MSTGYMVALDVDRTLLTDDYRLLPIVRDAVQSTRIAGVRVALCTARAPVALVGVLKDLGRVDAAICFGGAAIWRSPSEDAPFPVLDAPMAPGHVRDIVLECRTMGIPLAAYSSSNVHIDGLHPLLNREFSHTGAAPNICDLASLSLDVAKMLAISEPGETAALAELKRSFGTRLSCYFSHDNYLEIARAGVSKGRALEQLSDEWGVWKDRLIAVGDSENDLPMLDVAGVSIAMGNATDAVKRKADWVTSSNAAGGVAAALTECARLYGWDT